MTLCVRWREALSIYLLCSLDGAVPLGKSNLRARRRAVAVCNYCHRGRWRWNVVLKGNLSWRSLLPPPPPSYFLWSDLDVMRDDDGCYFITCGRPYNLLFSSIWNTIARGPARRLTIACHVGGGALKLEILRRSLFSRDAERSSPWQQIF